MPARVGVGAEGLGLGSEQVRIRSEGQVKACLGFTAHVHLMPVSVHAGNNQSYDTPGTCQGADSEPGRVSASAPRLAGNVYDVQAVQKHAEGPDKAGAANGCDHLHHKGEGLCCMVSRSALMDLRRTAWRNWCARS